MKTRVWAAALLWVLTVFWMVTIFMFSAQPAEESSAVSGSLTEWLVSAVTPDFHELSPKQQEALVEDWHNVIRKIAHLTEYGILGMLLTASLLVSNVRPRLSAGIAGGVSLLYAASDEVHQLFIESRGPGVVDVLIDFVGAAAGIAVILLGCRLIGRLCKNKTKKSK